MKTELLLLALLGFIQACSWGDNDKKKTEEPRGEQEILSSAGVLSIDEAGILATLEGKHLKVSIPVEKESSADLSGELQVTVSNLDGTVLAKKDVTVAALPSNNTLEVDLEGVDLQALPSSAHEAGYLLSYSLDLEPGYALRRGTSRLQGFKSLFFSLPKVDLRTGIPEAAYAGGGLTVRLLANDPIHHRPLQAQVVEAQLLDDADEIVGEVEGTTDEQGSVVLTLPEAGEGEYHFAASVKDSLYQEEGVEDSISMLRQAVLLVTTDKPFYQPGQTMHLRVLALEKPELTALAEDEVVFEVSDAKGNLVFRSRSATDEFGIASAEFVLGNQINLGHYEIKVLHDETETLKTVSVERYVLPRFKVNVDLDEDFYLPGQTVKGNIEARYFHGKPVQGGTVLLTASALDVGLDEFARVTGTTDAEGRYAFSFQLAEAFAGTPLEQGNALVSLTVEVTDSAEHTEAATLPLTVAAEDLVLAVVPEGGSLVPGLENVVRLFAGDPLGRPVQGTWTVVQGERSLEVEVEASGFARVLVTSKQGEKVTLRVALEDEKDKRHERTLTLDVGEAEAGLLLRTDRSLYETGEVCKVRVLSTLPGGTVFVDAIQQGQTVITRSLELQDGSGGFDLDLDSSLVGELLLEVYQVAPSSELVRDKRLIYVRNADALVLALTTDKEQYKPGDEAKLSFTVTDGQGKPQVAALGVQVVDEAVFALSDNRPGFMETYFTLQEELATPRYEIHGLHYDLPGLLTSNDGSEAAQDQAGLAFSALAKDGLLGKHLSSFQLQFEKLAAIISPYLDKERGRVAASILTLLSDKELEEEDLAGRLNKLSPFYDFWGSPFRFAGETMYDLVLQSSGPDELKDTSDDWQAPLGLEELYWNEKDRGGDDENADFAIPLGAMPPQAMEDGINQGVPPPSPGSTSPSDEGNGADGGAEVRVREYFPETLYVNPSLITNGQGKAELALTLADSITTWRVSMSGSTSQGSLGSGSEGILVFQDFFVDVDFPATLTRGDEVSFPVVVANYLDKAQQVHLELEGGAWFEFVGQAQKTLELKAGQVLAVHFPVKVKEAGKHQLTVIARGSVLEDAVRRTVLVLPDGEEHRDSVSGILRGEVSVDLSFPENLVPGSSEVLVKLYPGILAQAVEGLDSLLQLPSGCFEQTTSTTWPNVLVLDYLEQSSQLSPELELKASTYVNQGYQRLLTFETSEGGFALFGDPEPGNEILSAMGVMEFSDMSRVHEVDLDLIARTQDWVMSRQQEDGSWHTDQGSEFATVQYDDVKTTAFVAWALTQSAVEAPDLTAAITYLQQAAADDETDTYALALIANAFANHDSQASGTKNLLDRLADLAHVEEDGAVSWSYDGTDMGVGYPQGSTGLPPTDLEITALITQAFLDAKQHLELAKAALPTLIGNKDSFGNWGTTHATILSLRALMKSLQNKTEEGEGTARIFYGQELVQTLAITEENRNVFHQIELGARVDPAHPSKVRVAYTGTGSFMYQVVTIYHLPHATVDAADEPLSIEVAYGKERLAVDDEVDVTVTVTNNTDARVDMVMLDLGIPPGFDPLTWALDDLEASGSIQRYEQAGSQLIIYLEKLDRGEPFEFTYALLARYPVKVKTPLSTTYLYYDAQVEGTAAPIDLVVE